MTQDSEYEEFYKSGMEVQDIFVDDSYRESAVEVTIPTVNTWH